TTVYTSQTITTDDWLAPGSHITPATTAMTIPSYSEPYDANMVCTQWNYSTSSCGYWLMGVDNFTVFSRQLIYTTSDPGSNSWTSLAAPKSENYEGALETR